MSAGTEMGAAAGGEPALCFAECNGIQLAYLELGSGPLVLLLHGFPDTAQTWWAMMQRLAASGYRAVAPFLRGYDPSAIPKDGDYSVRTLAQDVFGLMDALCEQRAVVVGHDWGASVAYCMANLEPGRVSRLVTEAIPHPRTLRPSPGLLWRARHFLLFQTGAYGRWYAARDDYAYIEHLYRYWAPNWQDAGTHIAGVKEALRKPGRLEAAIGYYVCLFRDARDADKQKLYRAKTSVPTLTLAGDCDGALDFSAYDDTARAYTGPYELVRLPGVGHFPHCEAPDACADRLLRFLAS